MSKAKEIYLNTNVLIEDTTKGENLIPSPKVVSVLDIIKQLEFNEIKPYFEEEISYIIEDNVDNLKLQKEELEDEIEILKDNIDCLEEDSGEEVWDQNELLRQSQNIKDTEIRYLFENIVKNNDSDRYMFDLVTYLNKHYNNEKVNK